ncbi:hypothetical protein MMC07_004043 [Pseudocyphellaria aurata]|nr:hypothetical protein [Pseudocyphellaria aurata]
MAETQTQTQDVAQTLDPEILHDPEIRDENEEDFSHSIFHEAIQDQTRSNERRVTIEVHEGLLSLYDEHAARILSSVTSREEFVNEVNSQADAWREGITNLAESRTALRDQLKQVESTLEDTRAQLGKAQSHPPPTKTDEDEGRTEYEAEEIVDSTIDKRRKDPATGVKGCLMYKIKYRGDDKWNSKPSWQPWEDTVGCPYLVADYHHVKGDTKPGPHSSFSIPSDWKPSQDL